MTTEASASLSNRTIVLLTEVPDKILLIGDFLNGLYTVGYKRITLIGGKEI